jgi:hypothetical protein
MHWCIEKSRSHCRTPSRLLPMRILLRVPHCTLRSGSSHSNYNPSPLPLTVLSHQMNSLEGSAICRSTSSSARCSTSMSSATCPRLKLLRLQQMGTQQCQHERCCYVRPQINMVGSMSAHTSAGVEQTTHCMAPKSVPKAKRLMTSIVSHISAWSMSTLASGPSCFSTAASSAHAATVTGNPALHTQIITTITARLPASAAAVLFASSDRIM